MPFSNPFGQSLFVLANEFIVLFAAWWHAGVPSPDLLLRLFEPSHVLSPLLLGDNRNRVVLKFKSRHEAEPLIAVFPVLLLKPPREFLKMVTTSPLSRLKSMFSDYFLKLLHFFSVVLHQPRVVIISNNRFYEFQVAGYD